MEGLLMFTVALTVPTTGQVASTTSSFAPALFIAGQSVASRLLLSSGMVGEEGWEWMESLWWETYDSDG